ncbi:ectoine synthase [Microbispora hainanensis]|jgi:L-ectoine synthase|uniref:L-ectoine synthase n=1 Tax=Microbispora hainanensis TaxID=568844 RepID=A0ABZ1SL12_9ACTN|nr:MULTISPECIES: ectoine synthase [Microbispora]NJP29349.1 L-ectoine synthase [Microbispora sp. CL1-1]TQS05430.1 L-ectoine synthase [Microbispora sp. SCL1-1]
MIVRSSSEIVPVEWGNGTSYRLLTEADGMGFTVCETSVRKGTTSALQYRRHLEACYCTGGSGEIVTVSGERFKITEGTLYALNEHDAHYLVASDYEDLRLVSVFTPALRGDEKHTLSSDGFSQY